MKKCIVGAIVVLATVGCSRKSDHSSVSFSLPQHVSSASKAGQQAVSTSAANDPILGHVVLNISGPNMATIVRSFDKHNGGIPSTISIDVPKGDNRLIQVLAVYQAPLNQSMSFFYGDVLKSLSNASESADILVTGLGGSNSPLSGNIFGRYFNSPTGGPTADVATMFNPGSGKPRMIIERTTMFNGWFSLFALSSVPFEYEIQPPLGAGLPVLMWGGPVTLNSAVLAPNATTQNYLMRMASPVSIRVQNDSGGTSYEVEEPRYTIWGYWKSGAAITPDPLTNLNVCRESTGMFGTQLTKVKAFNSDDATWSTQPGLNGMFVSIGSSMPSDSFLSNLNSPPSQYYYQGGNPSTCGSPTDLYSLYLKVTRDMVDGNGNDNAGGFRAPFKIDAMGNGMTVTGTGSQRTLTGQLLPGVAGRIDELRIFKKTGLGSNFHEEDGLECGDVQKGAMGYVLAGSAVVDGTGNVSLTADISDSDVSSGTAAVVCTAKGGKLFVAGLRLGTWAFSPSGGGGPPTKLGVSGNLVGGPAVCNTVNIDLQDATGMMISGASNPSQVTVNLTASGVTFFDTCGGSTITYTQINSGNSSVSIGMSASTQGYYPYSFSAADLTTATGNYVVAPSGAATSLQISDISGNMLNALPNSVCVGVRLSIFDGYGSPASAYANSTINLVATPGLTYYSDASCVSPTSTLALVLGTSQASGYVKATVNGTAEIQANIASYDPNGSFTPYALSANYAAPVGSAGVPIYFGISGPSLHYDQCYTLTVESKDALGNPASMLTAAAGIMLWSQSSGNFFANSTDCTNGTPIMSPSQVNIAQGSTSSNAIYFRAPSGGGGQVRIDTSFYGGGGSQMRGSGSFSLSP